MKCGKTKVKRKLRGASNCNFPILIFIITLNKSRKQKSTWKAAKQESQQPSGGGASEQKKAAFHPTVRKLNLHFALLNHFAFNLKLLLLFYHAILVQWIKSACSIKSLRSC